MGVTQGASAGAPGEPLVPGAPVNVAARLEQAAEPGTILLGEQTFRLVHSAVDVEPVAPVAAKGKTEPVVAHRLVRVLEGAAPFPRRLDTPLVGRTEELAALEHAYADARADRSCRLVTLLGVPGIG